MIGIKEMLWFGLFGSLVCIGPLLSQKHGHSMLAGAGWGVLAWFAAMSSYLICLFVHDWSQRPKRPKSENGLLWFELSVWAVFVVSVSLTLLIGRRLFS